MYFCSQSISARSSARPRYITIGAWVCVLIRPGQHDLVRGVDGLARPRTLPAIAVGVSDVDDRSAVDGDAPGRSTWPAAFP